MNKSNILFIIMFVLSGHASVQAIERTVGVLQNDPNVFNGYTLFAPIRSNTTYLIDNDGREVHSWVSDYEPANSAYLLENGDLLRPRKQITELGRGGGVQKLDWDGNLLWDFEYYKEGEYLQHHDIGPMANGNVLILAREVKTHLDLKQANTVCFLKVGRTDFFGAANSCQPIVA